MHAVPVPLPDLEPADDPDRYALPWLVAIAALLLSAVLAGALVGVILTQDGTRAIARKAEAVAPDAGPVRSSASASRPAQLTAAGEDLLTARGENLGFWVGDVVKGERLRVLSVVGARGFVVGTGEMNRIYVEFGTVGEDEVGTPPEVGDDVDLSGPLKAAPLEPERALDITGEPAEIVRQRGAYVDARRLAVS